MVGGSLAAVGTMAEASQTGRRSTMQRRRPRRSPLSTPRRAFRGVRLRARRAPKPVGVGATPGCHPKMERLPGRAHVSFGRVGSSRRAAGFTRALPARSSSQRLGRPRSDRHRDRFRAGCLSDARDLPHPTGFRGGTVQRARAGLDLRKNRSGAVSPRRRPPWPLWSGRRVQWPEPRIRLLMRWSAKSIRAAMPRRMHLSRESPA